MKVTKFIVYILALSTLWSCSDNYESDGSLVPGLTAHYLYASKTAFDYSYLSSAFSETFEIESYETPWNFSETPSWITLNPSSGISDAEVTLSGTANPSAEDARTAIFYLNSTVNDWSYRKAFSVSQGKAAPSVTVNESDTEISLSGGACSYTVDVTANCSWTASTTATWLTVSAQGNKLVLNAEANPSASYREGYVTIAYGTKTLRLCVFQSPAKVTSSQYTFTCENVATKYDVEITSETDWTAVASDSWINVTPTEGGSGTTTVSIEVAPNNFVSSRSGSVTIYTGENSRLQLSILQKGIYIETEASLDFSSAEEKLKLNVKSNTDWSVLAAPVWVSLSTTSGSGDGVIEITAQENPNTSLRSGTIVIGQTGLDVQSKVVVTQQGKYFSTGQTVLEFTDQAGSSNYAITSDAAWTTTLSDDWFSVTPSSGLGSADVSVSVTENCTTEERTGTITYSYAGSSTDIIVHQLSKYLTIDDGSFEFESIGGSHTIELSTNESWVATIEHDVDWLSLSQTSGIGNATLALTAKDNSTVNTRSTVLIIEPKYSQAVRILVSQKPKTLSVNTQNILFFANGGTSDVITVNTDGQFEVTGSASWLTITRGSDNTFTVTAASNGVQEVREGTVTVRLTNLSEGSLSIDIPVVQTGQGGTFILNGYSTDSDWNNKITSGSIGLTVKGYTTDSNWDSSKNVNLTVTLEGYSQDNDWNANVTNSGKVTTTPYASDANWNSNSANNGSFTQTTYGNDNNWNSATTTNSNVTNSNYGEESNWNTNTTTTTTVTNSSYGNDSDWNNKPTTNSDISNSNYTQDNDWNNN